MPTMPTMPTSPHTLTLTRTPAPHPHPHLHPHSHTDPHPHPNRRYPHHTRRSWSEACTGCPSPSPLEATVLRLRCPAMFLRLQPHPRHHRHPHHTPTPEPTPEPTTHPRLQPGSCSGEQHLLHQILSAAPGSRVKAYTALHIYALYPKGTGNIMICTSTFCAAHCNHNVFSYGLDSDQEDCLGLSARSGSKIGPYCLYEYDKRSSEPPRDSQVSAKLQ
jgi:hypothetical protein